VPGRFVEAQAHLAQSHGLPVAIRAQDVGQSGCRWQLLLLTSEITAVFQGIAAGDPSPTREGGAHFSKKVRRRMHPD
jgi:hypothetical protein